LRYPFVESLAVRAIVVVAVIQHLVLEVEDHGVGDGGTVQRIPNNLARSVLALLFGVIPSITARSVGIYIELFSVK